MLCRTIFYIAVLLYVYVKIIFYIQCNLDVRCILLCIQVCISFVERMLIALILLHGLVSTYVIDVPVIEFTSYFLINICASSTEMSSASDMAHLVNLCIVDSIYHHPGGIIRLLWRWGPGRGSSRYVYIA